MNFILMLYLTFIRGPRIMREKAEREEAERLAQEEYNRKHGIVVPPKTCKKCDAKIGNDKDAKKSPSESLCAKCYANALKEAQGAQDVEEEVRLTPFLVFQLFGIAVALIVFFSRNIKALF
ncbi:hypothetical protein Poli38472_005261 [Pythium oligandrum]|uniref:Uncharacterized protein n=1 Tax=Pythium oligandrum TaxID=41045 RepID=A0A8K1CGM2_PYTOL|nr:hypothetical protein Poli38472_005261 [Pythium oligandrum]|eukprot:TMW62643.1 hypothetical protein Poli38472_005261 [Pythium oligandrum]